MFAMWFVLTQCFFSRTALPVVTTILKNRLQSREYFSTLVLQHKIRHLFQFGSFQPPYWFCIYCGHYVRTIIASRLSCSLCIKANELLITSMPSALNGTSVPKRLEVLDRDASVSSSLGVYQDRGPLFRAWGSKQLTVLIKDVQVMRRETILGGENSNQG